MSLERFMTPPRRVFVAFALHAFAMANLFPRLPAVKEAMGVGEGALGLGLIGGPVGTLLALTFIAPLVERIGHRRVIMIGLPLQAAFFALAVHAPDPLTFFLALIPAGLCIGSVELVINVEADRVEYAAGRRIMSRAHAFWSFGSFGAGMFGALLGHIGLSPAWHMALVVPVIVAGLFLLLSGFEPAPARHRVASEAGPRLALPSLPILVLVAVTLSAMLLEGASLDWGAIFMRNEYLSGPFFAGLAVASMAISQAIARFVADAFFTRFSPVSVARVLLVVLLAGCLLVVFSPHWLLSLLGFSLIGVGSSAIFPMAISAAAQRTDRSVALNVASLAQFSFVVFLLGPPLLGFVAEAWGMRAAFAIGLPLVLLSLATAGSLGRRG